jgi:hypothetical protein
MKRLAIIAAVAAALILAACGGGSSKHAAGPPTDRSVVQSILNDLRARYPLPVLTDSSDLHNQIQYARVQSDPNKIEYLEFLSLSGTPIANFTIRGQVSAEATRITSPVRDHCFEGQDQGEFSCVQDPQPDLTGTYFSQSGGGYFAYLTDGALIQWPASVLFITSDQPFKTSSPVQLNIDETKAITATHSHVTFQKNTAASTGGK